MSVETLRPAMADHPPGQIGRSAPKMCNELKMFRLAIGLFSEAQPLWHVLSDLSGQGIDAHSLCLVGQPHSLRPEFLLAKGYEPHQAFRSLFEDLWDLDGVFDDAACKVSAGPLVEDLWGSASGEVSGAVPGWLSDVQRRRLRDHLANGVLVLVVSSESPSQQDASCRILLRHSQHGVQTHDFSIQPAANSNGRA